MALSTGDLLHRELVPLLHLLYSLLLDVCFLEVPALIIDNDLRPSDVELEHLLRHLLDSEGEVISRFI